MKVLMPRGVSDWPGVTEQEGSGAYVSISQCGTGFFSLVWRLLRKRPLFPPQSRDPHLSIHFSYKPRVNHEPIPRLIVTDQSQAVKLTLYPVLMKGPSGCGTDHNWLTLDQFTFVFNVFIF